MTNCNRLEGRWKSWKSAGAPRLLPSETSARQGEVSYMNPIVLRGQATKLICSDGPGQCRDGRKICVALDCRVGPGSRTGRAQSRQNAGAALGHERCAGKLATWVDKLQASLLINQAASENVVLSDSLGYQALNARAAKVSSHTNTILGPADTGFQDALSQRTQILEDSQNATKNAINKRRNVERMKGSSNINPAKVDDALHEMEDVSPLRAAYATPTVQH